MRMVFGRQADHELLGLSFLSLLDSQLATIVSAARAYSVVDVMCATVRANSQSRHFSSVMRTTFRLSGVRLSSFRMCHSLFTILQILQITILQFFYCISGSSGAALQR
jgi:hypothetical protein